MAAFQAAIQPLCREVGARLPDAGYNARPSVHRSFKNDAALAQHGKDKGHSYVAPSAPRASYPQPAPAAAPQPVKVAPAPKPAAVPKAKAVPKVAAVPAPAPKPVPKVAPTAKSATPAPPAFECKPCCLVFTDQTGLSEHKRSKHPSPPTYNCVPCAMQFSSPEALSIHLRYFAAHPKCPECQSPFLDQTQLDMHMKLAHPEKPKYKCAPCGWEVAVSDLPKHFRESPNHPVCFVCDEGFLGDSELNTHMSSAHLEFRCEPCRRQLRSKEDLLQHYVTSPLHPHCALCEVGFVDDEACDKHMEINHPRPPPRLPTPSTTSMNATVSVLPSTVEPPCSTQSSPLVQRPSLNIVHPAASAVVNEKSELDDDTYETVEASSHVQRAVSEPTLPTASSMGPSSVQGVPLYSPRSPTISERSFDDIVRRRGTLMRHPDSESTLSIRSVSTVSSRSHSRLRSPVPTNAELQPTGPRSAVVESTYGMTDSVVSELAPRPSIFPQRMRSITPVSVSERMSPGDSRVPSRLVVDTPRTRSTVPSTISRSATPTSVRTPIRSTASRPLSRVSLLSSKQPAPSPSQKPSTTAVEPTPLSDSEGTVEAAPAVTHKLKGVARAQGKMGAVSWHCRSCMQDPCVAPTATMCGHIFCTA
ncbi:Zinc finger protein 2 [Trametes pubescens]|uniref:Zinc finger protein 2 n=1 Tax=Trametes pubescens TaxID=154538 RepID=A0A1M2V285_TRAPU|nr:Zinc finger protein 2 [Trametes pubescens]